MKQYRRNNQIITVVENGINIAEIDNVKNPKRKKYDYLSAGRIVKNKNFGLFIDSINVIKSVRPNVKALIIGDGLEYENLKKQREELKLEKNLDILPFRETRKELYKFMKNSKVFVLLSIYEGFSLVSFEAMRCGLPVLTIEYETNALKSYITKDVGTVVKNLNAKNIAKKMENLLQNYQKKGKNAKKLAYNYSTENKIKELTEFYHFVHSD